MEEEQQQKELFEFEPPKRHFPRLSNIFPKPDFEGKVSITLTLEKIIFISIGIVMLMVVIYALGVEKGKGIGKVVSPASLKAVAATPQRLTSQQVFPTAQPAQGRTITQTSILNTAPVPGVKARPAMATPYTIVAATFMRKDTATQEMNRFKSEGLDAFIVQSGNFYRLCVGTFSTRDSAQKTLPRVRQRFKDAFIKLK
jgi:hypothetical protein